jgi:HlyD family secretion protein
MAKKTGFLIALVVILAIAAFAMVRKSKADAVKKAAAQDKPTALTVAVTAAKTQEMTKEFVLTGTIRAKTDTTISAQVADRVLSVNVREGDRVSVGQVLVTMNSTSVAARLQQAVGALSGARSQVASAQNAYQVALVSAPSQLQQAQAGLTAAKKRLAIVKSGARDQERAVARNAMAAAQSGLNKAEADLKRAEQLYKQGAVAREQIDAARTAYDVAKSQYESAREQYELIQAGARAEEIDAAEAGVQQAQAQVDAARAGLRQVEISRLTLESAQAVQEQAVAAVTSARNDLANTILRAPINGVVYGRNVDVGDVPGVGNVLMRVAALEQVYFEATVPEKDFVSLSVGQRVNVSVDALPGQTIGARLTRLVPVANQNSRDFIARIEILNPGMKLRPGMFARGLVLVERHMNAIVIPNEALLGSPGAQNVYVVVAGKAQNRKVKTGLQNATSTEIVTGLNAGEQVVTAGQQGLKTGQAVSVKK